MSLLESVQAVRQNHAVEHATIHVLSRRNPYRTVMGRSTPSGFIIYGQLTRHEVAEAADEALARLQRGEAHLAVHPRCGTNLAVTGLVVGTATFGTTLGRVRTRLDRLPLALTVATLAALVAQPLANAIQERITTTPDVQGLYVAAVHQAGRGRATYWKVALDRQ